MSDTIISTIITAGMAFLGVYISNKKAAALMEYRLKQLEEKVNKHNNLIERMYAAEQTLSVHEEKMKVASHRIDDLEKEKKNG